MLMAPPNVKIKHITRSPSSSGDTRFPKLDECAHFHYENVELGPIKVLLCDKATESNKLSSLCSSSANKENEADRLCFLITVISNSRKWVVRRSYKNFMFLDTQLHRCVYDRKYSLLKELPNLSQDESDNDDFEEKIHTLLSEYLERFSQLAGSLINCGPVLNWFELDNRGNRLIVTDEVAINTPAVAAAYVILPHSSQATDEISFDVGDMISVIDMPPPEESSWWRGKKGFEVGFFPSECVEVIGGDKVPHAFKLSNASTKPVFRRHGKLIAFFRSFLLSRPSRRKLKQSGILKERVFGCDLGEHLLNTGREIPMVLKCCAEFIEEYGVVDGIYRLSGVSSNIQRLRLAFDEDRPLNLGDPSTVHDIHSVASLLKMYFRELPNPLLTYQLYDKFVSAVQSTEDVRLLRVRDVVQQLPPPHFRTLQYLLRHLATVASHGDETGMTPKNIAIVWAPNLLRSRDVENGGVGALHVVGVQAVLTEYLIRFSDLIFDEKVPSVPGSEQGEGFMLRTRPKSLAISTPTKLLSLEEARARALSTHLPLTQQKYIEVGGGPDKLPSKYHTVIDLPSGKQSLPKLKKSPSGWKSFFSRGWYSGSTRDKSRQAFRTSRKASTGSLPHPSGYMMEKPATETDDPYSHRKKLRTVKSAESLVHCLKESPQSTNKDEIDGNSHKSSPQVSVDSASSSVVVSPLSKSPGLQKHTRSSSHESYFESNSMDIISEPSFEDDEHGLFYYVSEQMRMLQNSSSLPWHSNNAKSSSPTENQSENKMEGISESSVETEKSTRKQKSTAVEDGAQAKVQRLTEVNLNTIEDSTVLDFQTGEASINNLVSRLNYTQSDENVDYNNFEKENFVWQPQNENVGEFSTTEDEGLTIDPMLLYDAIINKRSSIISSSDTDTDVNNRTVVERYGNAETVLVEVHATQDSSSEEEQCTNFASESLKLETDTQLSDEMTEENNLEFDDLMEEKRELESSVDSVESPTLKSQSPMLFEDLSLSLLKSENPTVESSETSSSNTDVLNELDDLSTCDAKPSVEIESIQIGESLSSVRDDDEFKNVKFRKEQSKLLFEDQALHKETVLRSEKAEKVSSPTTSQEVDTYDSFSIIAPPSPVYPPKSLKLQDFQSLKTKLETVPAHKKKHIIIPSPSSPIEEVRKKFELHASNAKKLSESPTSDIRPRPCLKDWTKKSKKVPESHDSVSSPEDIDKVETIISSKSESVAVNKRHSEPPPKLEAVSPTDIPKRMSNKYESETAQVPKSAEKQRRPTAQQPSLFTQLKVRKLQSLQAEVTGPPPEPIDPWSDPILDMQEDYHPMIYSPSHSLNRSLNDSDAELEDKCNKDATESDSQIEKISDDVFTSPSTENPPAAVETKMEVVCDVPVVEAKESASDLDQTDSQQVPGKPSETAAPESEAVKRERINRIKEERRAQLREKLKPQSFRLEAEEKEKVQTKFRLRKDCCRYGSTEDNSKDVKKSDKAVETDSADITETGTNCDLSAISDESNSRDKSSDKLGGDSDVLKRPQKETLKLQEDQSLPSKTKKSTRSYEDRKWLSMPPTDIRDKVAMFERSKDTKELCRLGPNGKFIQKQSPSALTSSFVR